MVLTLQESKSEHLVFFPPELEALQDPKQRFHVNETLAGSKAAQQVSKHVECVFKTRI